MKKSFTQEHKLLKVMKICSLQVVVAMTLSSLAFAHNNFGQILDKKITITLKEVSITEALEAIESLTDVKFFFSVDQLNVKDKISIEAVDRPLADVLNKLLTPYHIKYKVHEKRSAITLKKQAGDAQSDAGISHEQDTANSTTESAAETITGKVTEAMTQQPMAGVNVIVKGTTSGTTTDSGGQYSIHADRTDILVFSFIGYKSFETVVGERTIIDLSMEEDVASLEEVVVYSTGYDAIPAERSTGSFTHLGKELLERNVGTDVLSRLNGLTPGLLVDQRNGSTPYLNIRGRSTILASDQPLIVVDNFPYNGDINTINPNDIESITILKDAAAASIWGVRAGNGVIVITTKKELAVNH